MDFLYKSNIKPLKQLKFLRNARNVKKNQVDSYMNVSCTIIIAKMLPRSKLTQHSSFLVHARALFQAITSRGNDVTGSVAPRLVGGGETNRHGRGSGGNELSRRGGQRRVRERRAKLSRRCAIFIGAPPLAQIRCDRRDVNVILTRLVRELAGPPGSLAFCFDRPRSR